MLYVSSRLTNCIVPRDLHKDTAVILQRIGALGFSYPSMRNNLSEDDKFSVEGIANMFGSDDVLILQYPDWESTNHNLEIMCKAIRATGCKIITHIQDIMAMQFNYDVSEVLNEIKFLDSISDIIILQTREMYDCIIRYGYDLDIDKIVFQNMWDYLGTFGMPETNIFNKTMTFPTMMNYRGGFKYHGNIEIQYYGPEVDTSELGNFKWSGYKIDNNHTIHSLYESNGFTLVWATDELNDCYYKYNIPYKIAVSIIAGIPLIARKGTFSARYIEETGTGFTVDSLEEASERIEKMSSGEYLKYKRNVRKYKDLLQNGAYTIKAVNEALFRLCEMKIEH